MSDGITVTPGVGRTIHGDVVTLNGTSGLAQIIKVLSAVDGSTNKLSIHPDGAAVVHVTNVVSAAKSGTWGMTVTGTINAAKSGVWGMTVSGTVAVTKSGTWGMTVSQSSAPNFNAQVQGLTAHNGTTVTKPVVVGGRARTTLSAATLAATHAVVNTVHDLDGVLIARSQVPLGNILTEYVSATTSASTAFSTFTATTLLRNYITSIVLTNSGATGINIDLRNGTGGSVLMKLPNPSPSATQKGGATFDFAVPFRQTSTNTALAYDASASLGSGYSISLIGFQSKL